MTGPSGGIAELHDLLERLVDRRQFTADERVRLNALLAQGPATRQYYRDFFWLHCELEIQGGVPAIDPRATGALGQDAPLGRSPAVAHAPAPPVPAVPVLEPTAVPSFGYSLLAYVLGGALLATGLFAAWMQTSFLPARVPAVAQHAARPAPSGNESAVSGNLERSSLVAHPRSDNKPSSPTARDDLSGKLVTITGGSRRIHYQQGADVTLQAPTRYVADAGHSGLLVEGTLLVSVSPSCTFTLRGPRMSISARDAEYGVEIGPSGRGWVQVFRGRPELRLRQLQGDESAQRIVLEANESVQLGDCGAGCVATVIRDAGLAASLANRMPASSVRREAGPFAPLEAVVGTEVPEGPPDAAATNGERASTGDRSSVALISTKNVSSIAGEPPSYTVHKSFKLEQFAPDTPPSQLVPGRVALRFQFVARTRFMVCAVRLNGRSVPLPEQRLDGAVRQSGALTVEEGIVGAGGTNVLELDLRSADPRDELPEGPLTDKNEPVKVLVEVGVPPHVPQ